MHIQYVVTKREKGFFCSLCVERFVGRHLKDGFWEQWVTVKAVLSDASDASIFLCMF